MRNHNFTNICIRILHNFIIKRLLLGLRFNLAILDACVAWRQTGGCNPDGRREQKRDKTCTETIRKRWSGYCECADGSRRMEKGCREGAYETCYDACYDVMGGKIT